MPSANSEINVFSRLLPYLWPYRKTIALGLVLLVVSTPLGSLHPLIWRYIVDNVITKRHVSMLLPALGLMWTLDLSDRFLSSFRDILLERVGQKLVFDLRNQVYDKLQAQSLSYLQSRRTGDLISRAMSDVDVLQDVAVQGIDFVISNLLGFLFVAGVLIALNWKLGIATLAPIVVVFFLTRFFNLKVKAIYKETRERLGDVSARLQENLNGVTLIKAFAKERRESERFRSASKEYLVVNYRAITARNVFFPGVRGVGFLSNIIAIGYGAWLTIHGQFTIGGLVAYRGYWWPLFSPINQLATINELLQRARAAGQRVFELLDEPIAVADAPNAHVLNLARGTATVAFENVIFSYGDKPVLIDVSFVAEPGQMIALVGPSGAGKSTILHLIPRFWDVTGGRVTVGGQDVRDVTQESLRRQLAMVQQDTFLFNGTVLDNIRYGRPDASAEQIETAARAANAHDFILAMPSGYGTEIGERGVKLSGGQKQRLSIARAFLADPEILILDEPTSSVEPESESIITQALERLMQGRTTFVTSHRLSLVRGADMILVFDQGRLVEQGSHVDLIAQDGLYASMVGLQLGK